jgi:hypothetical protein
VQKLENAIFIFADDIYQITTSAFIATAPTSRHIISRYRVYTTYFTLAKKVYSHEPTRPTAYHRARHAAIHQYRA